MGPNMKICAKLSNLFNYAKIYIMKKIKSIIFDLGAVLLNINYTKTISDFEKIGVKNASTFYSKIMQDSIFDDIEIGKISELYFLETLKSKTENANINQVKKACNAMLLDLPNNRLNVLKSLKNKYKIFLLSNTNSIHISEFVKKIGIKKYQYFTNLFEKIYYSHEIGLRKPQKECFQLILNENNLLAKEVLFIDDSYQHILGAKKLGIQTYHLKDDEEITTLFPDIIQ